MELLFIENRYKTYFYEPIAKALQEEGHKIYWLVQNKDFTPKLVSKKYVIPYPKKNINGYQKDDAVETIIKLDRQQNHFKQVNKNYFYYYKKKIDEIIDDIQPNLVFGESTSFHELLAINSCEKKNILYLNPSTCRYPVGRFSFYKYDSLVPYKGSNEELTNEKAKETIEQIIYRKAVPDYMKAYKPNKVLALKDKFRKVLSYTKGERFNTPNPLTKYKVERQKNENIQNWDSSAKKEIKSSERFVVLYPLQMQPEANIDVWGQKYRDQTKLIKEIKKSLPVNTILYIKPNPKSKYELSKSLIDFVNEKEDVVALHHSTKMDDVFVKTDLVITVTGTIAIECVLSNKPIITLTKTIINTNKNCKLVTEFNEIPEIIETIKNDTFHKNSEKENIDFINLLNKTSYKGKVTDPYSDASCLNKENISFLFMAFNDVIKNVCDD